MATVQTRSAHSGTTPVSVSITTTAGNLLGIVTGSFASAAAAPSRTGETNSVGVADFADLATDHLRGDYMMNIGGTANTVTANGDASNGTACSVTEFSGRATTSALGAGVNHGTVSGATIQPGSITPTATSDLMTGTGDNGTNSSASTINLSFTVDEVGGANTVWDGGTGPIGGSAHLDNVAASPINPTWTATHAGTTRMCALIMEFLTAAGASTLPPGLGPALQMQPAHTLTIGW